MLFRAWLLAALLLPTPVLFGGVPPEISGCSVFPSDNIWNAPVDSLPLDPSSAAYVATIGASNPGHADFGSGLWNGGPIGIPYVVVNATQAKVPVRFDYNGESDPGPYPVPKNAPIEGGSQSSGDRHVLVLERDHCILYELYNASPQPDGSWTAGSGAVFDLKSNALRPLTWTSADAAGLPILPGLLRYDEVASGEIRHAIRFTVEKTQRAFVWPGRHYASSITDKRYPPMGQRFRLRAGFDISGYSPEVQVILRALKKYGMILADNGSNWFFSGVPDARWNNENLHQMSQLHGSDFEAVDVSSLRLAPDLGQVKTAGPAGAVVNGATFAAGPIAPGEIVSIFGVNFGPAAGLGLQVDSSGFVSKKLGDTTVSIGGAAAPLLYVSATQVNTVAPYAVAELQEARVQVFRNGTSTFDATVPVTETSPGLFAITDAHYRANTNDNPVAPGEPLILFATGEGETTPPGQDGRINGQELPKPRLPVKVLIGSQEARVQYAGAAPQLVTGVLQVNVQVPPGLAPGEYPLILMVGQHQSPAGTSISVR